MTFLLSLLHNMELYICFDIAVILPTNNSLSVFHTQAYRRL